MESVNKKKHLKKGKFGNNMGWILQTCLIMLVLIQVIKTQNSDSTTQSTIANSEASSGAESAGTTNGMSGQPSSGIPEGTTTGISGQPSSGIPQGTTTGISGLPSHNPSNLSVEIKREIVLDNCLKLKHNNTGGRMLRSIVNGQNVTLIEDAMALLIENTINNVTNISFQWSQADNATLILMAKFVQVFLAQSANASLTSSNDQLVALANTLNDNVNTIFPSSILPANSQVSVNLSDIIIKATDNVRDLFTGVTQSFTQNVQQQTTMRSSISPNVTGTQTQRPVQKTTKRKHHPHHKPSWMVLHVHHYHYYRHEYYYKKNHYKHHRTQPKYHHKNQKPKKIIRRCIDQKCHKSIVVIIF